MSVNLRRNHWTNADESLRKTGESFVIPASGTYRVVTLAEVPRQDAPSSIRVYEAGSGSEFLVDKDAMIYEGNPTTAYGTQNYLKTGRDGTGLFYRYHSLLHWTNGSLPTLVDQVLMRVNMWTQASGGYPNERTIGIHEVQAAWTESTVTWNTAPAHNLVAATSFKVTVTGAYDTDITDLYRGWIAGTNNGLLIKDANDPDVDNSRSYDSRENTLDPRLIIAEPGDLYTEVAVNTEPAAGQFAVNYQLGLIRFNPADAGKTIYVDYWGTGSLLWA